ncbi:MAG: hypothetical protein K8F59_17365 [Rhodobacteraceae bacterium]|nr:hypothetical protein [Paracoccaceae bacterium]MCB1366897.1 hypothetical protein [Paracoccaceae bacterium]
MEVIEHNGRIISIIHRDADWKKGLDFITPNDLFVQVGTWWYDKGKKLASHIHKDFDRPGGRTMESVYVRRGAMKVILYTEARERFHEYELHEGDMAVFAYGGHGYEILRDDTQIIESKNGPFVDVETDKVKFKG